MNKLFALASAAILFAGACSAAEYREPKHSFGAIAAARENTGVGSAVNWPTQEEASRQAMAQCQETSGGKACQIRITFRNACAAVAQSSNLHAGYAWGDTPEKAQQEALNACRGAAQQDCRITHNFCSKDRPATTATLYK